AKISPARTSKETSPTAVTFPNDFTTCWTRMIGRSLTTCVLRPRRRRFGRVDELVVVAHRQAGGRRVVDDDGRITVQLDGTGRIPSVCRSSPPHSAIRPSYHWQKAG